MLFCMFVAMMMVMMVLMLVIMIVMMFLLFTGSIQPVHIMVVILMLGVQNDVEITSLDSALNDSRYLNLKALCRNTGQNLLQLLPVSAQIQQCADRHVSADAGITL